MASPRTFHDHKDIGTFQRVAIILSAICCCLVTAGLVFGFSALMPSLLNVGAFVKVCQPGERSCNEQTSRTGAATNYSLHQCVLATVMGRQSLDFSELRFDRNVHTWDLLDEYLYASSRRCARCIGPKSHRHNLWWLGILGLLDLFSWT